MRVRCVLLILLFCFALAAANAQVVNFGSVNVGTASPVQMVTYTFSSPTTTLSAVNILTAGVVGSDYADGGSTTCTANTAYSAGQSCTVTVTFTPSGPGLRPGGVTLFAQGSNLPLMTWYLNGVGQAGAVTIDPGTQSTIGTLTNGQGYGMAVDGNGNLYVADNANSQVIELVFGTLTPTTIVSSGILNPTAVALDGAGNLYISDTGDGIVVMVPNEQGTLNSADMSPVNISGLGSPNGIAVDGSGNLYVVDGTNGDVLEFPAGGGIPATVASGLTGTYAVAVDSLGNVYVTANNSVTEYQTPFTGMPISLGSGYNNPTGVAVDASGAVYVADAGNSRIVRVAPGGNSQATMALTGLSNPQGVGVDVFSNVYITDADNVYEVNRNQPAALTFGTTFVGSVTVPQTLTVSNAGNQPLNVSNVEIAQNFAQMPSGGTDCTSGTQLPSSEQCLIAVAFAPIASGTLTGTLVVADDALNSSSQQDLQLSGAASQVAQIITFPAIPTQTYGAGPLSLNAAASSGLPVSFGVTSGPANISGNVLTLTGAGAVTVQASQGGNGQYAPAAPVSQTFAVNPAATTVVWSNPAPITYGTALSATQLDATATPVSTGTYVYTPPAGTVLNVGSQPLSVQFTPSNTSYAAATGSVTLQVNQASQTIEFTVKAPQYATDNSSFTVAAIASSGLPVSFTSSGVCTNVGATYTMTSSTGTCSVIANQAGSANYLAAPTVTEITTASTGTSPTVTFTGAPATAPYNSTFTVVATSNSPVVPTIKATGACSIRHTTVTMTNSTGTCTMTASWAANKQYLAASLTQTTTAELAASIVTWATPAPIIYPTPLSSTQLDATANVIGKFAYSPPSGKVLSPGNQTLSVQFTPTSKKYAPSTGTVTLTVNQAPTITSTNSAAFSDGTLGSFTVTTTGFPTPALSEAGALPAGVTLVDNGNGTAALQGTPAPSTPSGVFNITITAQNGVSPYAAQSFALTVSQVSPMVAARFLEQSSWGPTPASIAQVQQVGLQAYLQQQFSAPVSTYPTPGPKQGLNVVQQQFFVNAMNGQDQLRQRVSFATSEIIVDSSVKKGQIFPPASSLWMNTLQNDTFGNFYTLLNDVTLSPSMGYYLDMVKNDGCSRCRPNENYAREVLQLFTIGLNELNIDGTPQLDQNGNPIPTYDQGTVIGFSQVFTGWSYPPAPGQNPAFNSQPYFGGPMLPFNSHHSQGSKSLLNGATIPAGGNIEADLQAGLQNIFNHPNVGQFFCQQLIQKLVTSNPSPAYVSRVAQVFNDDGTGVRGNLQAVVTAILLDPEARRGDDPTKVQPSDGHLREPLLYMMNAMLALNATTDGAEPTTYASNMLQAPFTSPDVFNFYPPNFQVPGTQLLGPEFNILNASSNIWRINFINYLIYQTTGTGGTTINISPYVGAASNVGNLLAMVNTNIMHGQMPSDMYNTLFTTLSSSAFKNAKPRAQAALYLTLSSSQFQVEH